MTTNPYQATSVLTITGDHININMHELNYKIRSWLEE